MDIDCKSELCLCNNILIEAKNAPKNTHLGIDSLATLQAPLQERMTFFEPTLHPTFSRAKVRKQPWLSQLP